MVTRDFAIVGVGASAGGIRALQHLFRALPPRPDVALVVVQHLLPGQSATLVDLIGNWTPMPVCQAADDAEPQRNHVYVARPDDLLTLENGVFRTQVSPGGERRPRIETIDSFFKSLASERGPGAIGIVLSGTARDGTAGAICIRQAGGTVFVQDPLAATHAGMPQAVIATGAADYVLPVEAIAQWLMARSALATRAPAAQDIPTHRTEFFRDPIAWETLDCKVLPALVKESQPDIPIRIWTPACSSGEEAYSLAMLLSEQTAALPRPPQFKIFATDASPEMLRRAATGVFSLAALEGVSARRKERFFQATDGSYHAKPGLREQMIFAPQDLLSDPPFSHLDLVTCRNLLIYLDPEGARRALLLLHGSLRMGGYLFLGKAEALAPGQEGFEPVSHQSRIYRKVAAVSELTIRLSRYPEDDQSSMLRAATEVARISREKLQASQQELEALNEELEATNEQLNFTNEDLKQANSQLRERIAELEMQGRLLSSGAIMSLFLDTQLRVCWFTPSIRAFFPLTKLDVGRPITDLAQRFEDTHFIRDIRAVMQTSEPRGARVRNKEGVWFLRHIRPCTSAGTDEIVSGASVTFTEISFLDTLASGSLAS